MHKSVTSPDTTSYRPFNRLTSTNSCLSDSRKSNILNLPPDFDKSKFVKTLPADSLLRIQHKLKSFNQTTSTNHFFADSGDGNFSFQHKPVVHKHQDFSAPVITKPQAAGINILSKNSQCCLQKINHKSNMAYSGKGDFSEESKIDLDLYTLSSSVSTLNKAHSEYDDKNTVEILDPELNLSRLGYTINDNVDWNKIDLPPKTDLYEMLQCRIRDRRNTDFKVCIGNEEFLCHLIVLQSYSELVDSYTMIDKMEIPANKCSAESFRFIYDWMISEEKSYKELTKNNVLDIFESAQYLKINDLIEQCWAFLESTEIFSEDTAFLLYVQAKERNLEKICQYMLPRIENFFLVLVSSQDWLELDVDDIKEFLSSNYIKINCEMEIFMSAFRWLRYDWEQRKQYRKEIINCVRFGHLTPLQLINIKRNSDRAEFKEIVEDPDVCKLIDDGLEYVTLKLYKKDLRDSSLKEPVPRNWTGENQDYTNYRDFLIYLDQYRRKQIIEISKRSREKPAEIVGVQSQFRIDECTRRLSQIFQQNDH